MKAELVYKGDFSSSDFGSTSFHDKQLGNCNIISDTIAEQLGMHIFPKGRKYGGYEHFTGTIKIIIEGEPRYGNQ